MKKDEITRLLLLLLLCLLQALVLNHIHLLSYAVPLLCVYFAIIFPRNYPRWAMLIWCFTLGLLIDIFSNTPGMAAGSMTLTAAVQPTLLSLFVPRDADDKLRPSMKTITTAKFCWFSFLLTFLYCLCFFSLETLTFFNWHFWLLEVVGSSLLTFFLIIVIEYSIGK